MGNPFLICGKRHIKRDQNAVSVLILPCHAGPAVGWPRRHRRGAQRRPRRQRLGDRQRWQRRERRQRRAWWQTRNRRHRLVPPPRCTRNQRDDIARGVDGGRADYRSVMMAGRCPEESRAARSTIQTRAIRQGTSGRGPRAPRRPSPVWRREALRRDARGRRRSPRARAPRRRAQRGRWRVSGWPRGVGSPAGLG